MKIANNDKNPSMKLIKYGPSYFTQDFVLRLLPKMSYHKQKLQEDVLNIYLHKYSLPQWILALLSMHKSEITSARFSIDDRDLTQVSQKYLKIDILKSISHIHFLDLTSLKISDNRIDTLEPLTFLNVQKLKSIQIMDIFISNQKPFNKLNWKNLKFLQLRTTSVQNFNFHRFKTSNEELTIFWTLKQTRLNSNPFQMFRLGRKQISIQIDLTPKLNFTSFSKLQPLKFQYWTTDQLNIIGQSFIKAKLNEKFQQESTIKIVAQNLFV